ncbi:alpha-mannosidase [Streptococcus cuniculi]|uniref:Alpha-mannosidase n=1 Tax=Streptococcus cuniculi TaxID=1432788 RepID=A0A1Q8E7E6_9STRE|nr:alpha-mannosidase [Streptococcus cuniculi]OLF47690.1 alpha-mannosidase [Streptococcus cuniculi]
MENVVVHIISHSHWDREWYQSFEGHRMQLVELFDDLFDLFEHDPEFKSFHLDGQTIVLDDYLAIRPENRAKVQSYIDQGKLKIGPFYILQDDYLISSESNVRNSLIGHQECQKWGKSTAIGYFPDTFGNMGQAPQLLKQTGLDVAAFGRGVKPIGFDNQVLADQQFTSQFSEMVWQGADGSEVLGILFANWYSNGNEIPVDKAEAAAFWEQKLADVERYAATNQWLMMNGCDHQPVQKNLSEAIRVANELYPEITFVHSSFDEYVAAVKEHLPANLSQVTGELTSQETDGWYTLANTASARIYLKQAYVETSNLLEQVVEPLLVLTKGDHYQDQLTYAWKTLLQNAPHDSICGCSVDEVHREMEVRFEKAKSVAAFVKTNALNAWKDQLDTEQASGEYLFTVVNTGLHRKRDQATVVLEVATCDFKEAAPTMAFQRMSDLVLPNFCVQDLDGQSIPAIIEDLGAHFNYQLPNDAFRKAYIARQIKVTIPVDLEAVSWQTFQLVEGEQAHETGLYQDGQIETEYLKLCVEEYGLTLHDKRTGQVYEDFIQFEDRGDIGNEYLYFQPLNTQPIYAELVNVAVVENTSQTARLRLTHALTIPVSADEQLEREQEGLVEYMKRTAGRSQDRTRIELTTDVCVLAFDPQIRFKTRFTNTAKDHRIRVLFQAHHAGQSHEAESIFEVVERSNQPSAAWENPENTQRQQAFVSLTDDEKGVTVANKGLYEYEVLDDKTLALTILRAVGELGDWGYFPTPDAQCLRTFEVEYALECHRPEERFAAFRRAKAFQTPLTTLQVPVQTGTVAATGHALEHKALQEEQICPAALKQKTASQQVLLRYYNMSQEPVSLGHEAQYLNLLEEPCQVETDFVNPQEIRTELL